MPNDTLRDRIRAALQSLVVVEEKRMFGGTAFLVDGTIVATVRHDGDLMVRVDPERGEALGSEPGARQAAMGDRLMGPEWVQVSAPAVDQTDRLQFWLDLALARHRDRHPG